MEVKENPKSFWKFVRSKTQSRTGISDLKNDNGEWITNDKDKANELNYFFSSVFTKEENDEFPDFSTNIDSSISDIIVTENKVKLLLKQLNVSKSTGPDNFHPRFLRKLLTIFPTQLLYCSINLSVRVACLVTGNLQTLHVYSKATTKQSHQTTGRSV